MLNTPKQVILDHIASKTTSFILADFNIKLFPKK